MRQGERRQALYVDGLRATRQKAGARPRRLDAASYLTEGKDQEIV